MVYRARDRVRVVDERAVVPPASRSRWRLRRAHDAVGLGSVDLVVAADVRR